MPRTRLTYRIVYTTVNGVMHPGEWNCRVDGRPSEKNLRRHVGLVNSSFESGGSRALVGALFPGIKVIGARVVRTQALPGDIPVVVWGDSLKSTIASLPRR